MKPRPSNIEGCAEEAFTRPFREYAPTVYVTTPARPADRAERIMRWALSPEDRALIAAGRDIFMYMPNDDSPLPIYHLKVGFP